MLRIIMYILFACTTFNTLEAQTACTRPVIPDVITPNGDGYNDVLVIGCLDVFSDNHFTVYNRWGQIVYEAFNYDNNWDGTYHIDKGALPDGTYMFTFKTVINNESRTFSGNITIVR